MDTATPRTDGRQERWKKHKQERRHAVVGAAIALLEERPPGAEVPVADIAARSGVNRSVLYRHFKDRTDLDRAVQQEICERLGNDLLAVLTPDGTPRQIIDRIVATYVNLAVAHPTWVRFVDQDLPDDAPKPLDLALETLAEQIESVIEMFVAALGIELSTDDKDALEPWVFGLIGGCMQSVDRWIGRERLAPDTGYFAGQISDVVWFQVEGHARKRGIEIPDESVEDLITRLVTADALADGS
jgi:AcrR family transcriptional regulator